MRWALLDTNVYIDDWEGAAHGSTVADVTRAYIVRHSSVVLSELRRGARTKGAQRLVDHLFKLARTPWSPAPADWWEAGRLIRTVGDHQDWDTARRRDFQNDALIALTAKRYGATVVTGDREDFQLLAHHLRVTMLFC